ncbi:MAG: SDR family oxidoreductase [Xanthomonadales bacterium]
MNILFIGGTGIISSACTQVALDRGWTVTVLNRGRSGPPPDGCRHLRADVRDRAQADAALGQATFDAVLDFMAFVPEHVETAIDLFADRCAQYVFISSASAYQTPPAKLPVTEKTPLDNPFWAYSRDKIACEARLRDEMKRGFPVTIVRPSHTYGRQRFPFDGGYTVLHRIRRGKPVVLPGDGTSVWTLTHARDFAVGLLGLLGQSAALGEAFHITNDEWLTWNGIFRTLGRHLGREPLLNHLPSAAVLQADAQLGAGLLGDKAHSMIFDNAKIRRLVPEFQPAIAFAEGAKDIVDWYDEDPARRIVDPDFDALQDRLAALYARLLDQASG